MKKRTAALIIFILIIFSIFISFKIFERTYFNDKVSVAPNLKGLTEKSARESALKSKFGFRVIGEAFSDEDVGKVFQQTPEAGKNAKSGRTIRVLISKGKSQVKVVDFGGMEFSYAKVIAEKSKLNVDKIFYIHDSLSEGNVIATDPPAGEYLGKNGKINFLVSLGNENSSLFMPDIVGLELSSAKEILKSKNLILGNIDYITDDSIDNDTVLDTSPKSGEKVNAGTVITLTVNKK